MSTRICCVRGTLLKRFIYFFYPNESVPENRVVFKIFFEQILTLTRFDNSNVFFFGQNKIDGKRRFDTKHRNEHGSDIVFRIRETSL